MTQPGARPLRALLLPAGPDFHVPDRLAAALAALLGVARSGTECDVQGTLDVLADEEALRGYDVIVPVWTEGHLTPAQEAGLEAAVRSGTGLGCIHGAAAAFRESFAYQGMVGGQFVAHPGGELPYRVTVDRTHPVTEPVADFEVTTEQYYLHVDPTNRVLARTRFDGDFGPLSSNGPVTMPVAWVRSYGAGRVFCSTLGHPSGGPRRTLSRDAHHPRAPVGGPGTVNPERWPAPAPRSPRGSAGLEPTSTTARRAWWAA